MHMQPTLFLKILQNSFTSIKKYNHLLLLKNKIIFFYFCFWLFLLSLLQAIHFSTTALPRLFADVSHVFSEAILHYPDDLTFDWNGTDTLTANYNHISLHYPSGFNAIDYNLPTNLGVYTTTETEPTAEKHRNNLLVATPKKIYIQEMSGKWDSFDYTYLLSTVPQNIYTKDDFQVLHEDWKNQQNTILRSSQVVVTILATIFTILSNTVTLLMRALVVLLIAKYISQIQTNYVKSLKLSALCTIPALVIETGIIYLYGNDTYGVGGFTFWLLFILYIWFGKVTITHIPKKH